MTIKDLAEMSMDFGLSCKRYLLVSATCLQLSPHSPLHLSAHLRQGKRSLHSSGIICNDAISNRTNRCC